MKQTAATEKSPAKMQVSDVNEVKQSFRNAELRYRGLFESVRDGILIMDAETGIISDVNPGLIHMLGYAREDFVAKKLWEIDAIDDVAGGRACFHELQENEHVCSENLELKAKDGRPVQVELVGNVYQVGDGKILQCAIRGIGDRKRAEAALRAKEEARLSLIENLETYWKLIENLPVGVIIHAPDSQIVQCNSEASRLLGISSTDLLGKDARDPEWRFVCEDGTRVGTGERLSRV